VVALDVDVVPGVAPTPETEEPPPETKEDEAVEARSGTMPTPDVLPVADDCVGKIAKGIGNTAESY